MTMRSGLKPGGSPGSDWLREKSRAPMSARKLDLTFTPQARQDFYDILLYSGLTWGADQVDRYELTLHESIRRVLEHPESGWDCAHLLGMANEVFSPATTWSITPTTTTL